MTLDWFESYLSNRSQICKINVLSKRSLIKCGVPQGLNLGPLLYLIYVNDLPNCLDNATLSMFADDTNLTTTGRTTKELEENLNKNLEKVHQWLLCNELTLSTKKTEYMILGSGTAERNYEWGGGLR